MKKSKIRKATEVLGKFLKLLKSDGRGLLFNLVKYINYADRAAYFKTKYKKDIPFVDIAELTSIEQEINNFTFLKSTSQPIDIAFLMAICENYDNCNYLEIGSWRGESLVNVAKIAKKCTSISLSKEEILSMGLGQRVADTQRFFSKNVYNITHIEANSLTFDFKGLEEKFDVIFIDGDHSYEGVKSDTENAFGLLRDERSVIIWHDCGGGFEGFNYEVISAILDGAPADKRNKIYRVSNSFCGIFSNQKVTPLQLETPQFPNKVFSLRMKMQELEKLANH